MWCAESARKWTKIARKQSNSINTNARRHIHSSLILLLAINWTHFSLEIDDQIAGRLIKSNWNIRTCDPAPPQWARLWYATTLNVSPELQIEFFAQWHQIAFTPFRLGVCVAMPRMRLASHWNFPQHSRPESIFMFDVSIQFEMAIIRNNNYHLLSPVRLLSFFLFAHSFRGECNKHMRTHWP